MLTQEELEGLRETQAASLYATCTRQRIGRVMDAHGTWTEAPTSEVEYACRAWQGSETDAGAGDSALGERQAGRRTWTITLPWDADVRHGDRLVVDGAALEVRAVAFRGAHATALVAHCVEGI